MAKHSFGSVEIYSLKLRRCVWILAVRKKRTKRVACLHLGLIVPEKKPTNILLSAHMTDNQNLALACLGSHAGVASKGSNRKPTIWGKK